MHKPESVLESETHKLAWDIEIQTNNVIFARTPNQFVVNKKESN